ncbi:MAG: hypothetical protein Q8911_09355 [Bacillota bacterium]|nr:hypothetical protein [Bacillota bacterium]
MKVLVLTGSPATSPIPNHPAHLPLASSRRNKRLDKAGGGPSA